MESKKYLFRSMMFIPGFQEKFIEKALKTNADALIFDLEDSCLPSSNKKKGRFIIKEALKTKKFKNFFNFVRINPRKTGFFFDDIIELTIKETDGFLYPMANSKEDIIFFSTLLEEIELSKNLPKNHFKIFPVIETPCGILNAHEICKASKRVVALGFGAEDFTTNLESVRDLKGESIFTPRAMIALAARAGNVIPIDTPHLDVHNLKSLEENCILAKNLGFGGMQVLHPKEIDIVNNIYSPSEKEIDDAKQIIKLTKMAEAEGLGVAYLDGKFIGPPIYRRAKKTIQKFNIINKNQK